jgi:hypothetical protein
MPSSTHRPFHNLRLVMGAIVIAIGLAACTTTPGALTDEQRLHLRAAASDFAALGIGATIEKREDGRRTPRSSQFFEWWYFDGLLDDGTVVVVWFGDNWFYGSHQRTVSIEVTPPGHPTRKLMSKFSDPGSFAQDHTDVRIGPHTFEGDLDTYIIHVDAAATGGLGCDLTLRRRVPSYRPATGHIAAGDKFFAWLVAVPEGEIRGTLTADDVTRTVTGSGYHDHNWGNVSPADIFDGWWWGRGLAGEHTVIASVIRAKPRVGGDLIPLFFVGSEQATEVNAYGSAVAVSEGRLTHHPDPKHEREINSSVSFTTHDGTNARFDISQRVLTSSDLLEDKGFALRLAARVLGLHPWYTRFESPISLTLPRMQTMAGSGTLEYYELK